MNKPQQYFFYLMIMYLLLSACVPRCTESKSGILDAARDGNVELIKNYFENGGDPMLECTDYSGKGIWFDRSLGHGVFELHSFISDSESEEMVALYLGQDIPDRVKDKMLDQSLFQGNAGISELLIKEGAHLRAFTRPYWGRYGASANTALGLAKRLGYDINWQDGKEQDNTLLMKYCKYDLTQTKSPAIELLELATSSDEDYYLKKQMKLREREIELIRTIEFLLANGAMVNIKNAKGQQALDLCLSDTVGGFLKAYILNSPDN